jgi:hypothetical protein
MNLIRHSLLATLITETNLAPLTGSKDKQVSPDLSNFNLSDSDLHRFHINAIYNECHLFKRFQQTLKR